LGGINLRMSTNNYSTGLTFSQSGNSEAQAGLYVKNNNSNGTYMYLATTNLYSTGPQARVMIDPWGSVGIGCIAGSTLQVNGSAAIGYSSSTSASANGLQVAGNVGIGGANAVGIVDIYANQTVSNMLYLQNINTSYGTLITFPKGYIGEYGSGYGGTIDGINYASLFRVTAAANVAMLIDISGNYPIVFATNGAERMRTDATGVVVTGDCYTDAFQDWSSSSTVVGWSSFAVKQILYYKLGKQVTIHFWINGTSDNTSSTMTLPYANNSSFSEQNVMGWLDNGNTSGAGTIALGTSSSTVIFYKGMQAQSWTAANNKVVFGQFTYFTD